MVTGAPVRFSLSRPSGLPICMVPGSEGKHQWDGFLSNLFLFLAQTKEAGPSSSDAVAQVIIRFTWCRVSPRY